MNNDWLDITVLEDYLDGKLDAKTMNRVEREALEDPFVAEALAGLSLSPKRSLESLSLLQKQLHDRVAEHQTTKKTTVITWQRLSIAAAAAVIFISVGIIFWMKQVNYQEMLAKQPKKIEVNIAPKPTSDSVVENADAVAALKTKTSDKTSVEINKAIKAAKTNSYATVSKQKQHPVVPAQAVEETVALNEVSINAAPVQRKQSVAVSAASTVIMNDMNNVIRGRVVESKTGEPVQNAFIHIEGTKYVVNTDKTGEFVLKADSSVLNKNLIASSIGYSSKTVSAKINQPLNIELTEDNTPLSEVVVTGYQKKNKRTKESALIVSGKEVEDVPVSNTEQLLQGKVSGLNIIEASSPVGGWVAFKAYLVRENRFNKEPKKDESVVLSFSLKRGKPRGITIVKGSEEKYNKEAIRLLKDGPKWNQPKSDDSKISVVVDF